jgi:hypothetical protein
MRELDNTLIMVVSDNGRAPRAGHGTTNETQFFNNAPEPLEDSVAKLDELGGPDTFNHYPWGGRGRATPRSGGGSGRPTVAARATGS